MTAENRESVRTADEVRPPEAAWSPDTLRRVWTRPLPGLADEPLTRAICRSLISLGQRFVFEVNGLEHVSRQRDPFVLVLNHSSKMETMILPVLLIYLRDGHKIHFMADWNFQLIPGVGLIMRSGGVITVVQKPARPAFLNVFKRFFEHDRPALTRAQDVIESGRSVGIFPEGRVNRDPERLLAGHPGAARLSLETGAPVVPAGIRFPNLPPGRPISSRYGMSLTIGPSIAPPGIGGARRAPPHRVREWHAEIMRAIARLSGTSWTPRAVRDRSAEAAHSEA